MKTNHELALEAVDIVMNLASHDAHQLVIGPDGCAEIKDLARRICQFSEDTDNAGEYPL
jgi:hypothetical protein